MASEVIRKRWCKECKLETSHEIIVDLKFMIKTCLECGLEESVTEEQKRCT